MDTVDDVSVAEEGGQDLRGVWVGDDNGIVSGIGNNVSIRPTESANYSVAPYRDVFKSTR
jgi:hypothetical protein